MCSTFVIIVCLAVANATPSPKIVGGSPTTINHYPSNAALLKYSSSPYRLFCGGTILTTKSILTGASCTHGSSASSWRVRVGSSYANREGVLHTVTSIVTHSGYSTSTYNNDIAMMRTTSAITYIPDVVQPAAIATANYHLADNEAVWVAGWGSTFSGGPGSEQLQEVQVWTINQATCAQRYNTITENMLCSGWLDVGGRDSCQGDGGSALYHKGVVVGIVSWGLQCAQAYYPGVYTRVTRYTTWIQNNIY